MRKLDEPNSLIECFAILAGWTMLALLCLVGFAVGFLISSGCLQWVK